MPKVVIVSSGFGAPPSVPRASEHTNRASSGQAQQSWDPAPEPEQVVVDLTQKKQRQKHQGQGHQGNAGNSDGDTRRSSASSRRTSFPASSNPDSHWQNEQWRQEYFRRVQAASINAALARASSSHVQPYPENHNTPRTENQSGDSHRRAAQTPISYTPDRGCHIPQRDSIPPFRDPSPSIAPSESISTISARRRRLAAEEEYDDDDYENDDSYSSYSYRTERPPTRKEERYAQEGPYPVGYPSDGRPFY